MHVLNWVVEYWLDIIVLLLFVVIGYYAYLRWFFLWTRKDPVEKMAETKRVLETLAVIAVHYVNKAEIRFGSKTGGLKSVWVMEQLYAMIPDSIKPFVTDDNLREIVEFALGEAEKLWTDVNVKRAMDFDNINNGDTLVK